MSFLKNFLIEEEGQDMVEGAQITQSWFKEVATTRIGGCSYRVPNRNVSILNILDEDQSEGKSGASSRGNSSSDSVC